LAANVSRTYEVSAVVGIRYPTCDTPPSAALPRVLQNCRFGHRLPAFPSLPILFWLGYLVLLIIIFIILLIANIGDTIGEE